MAQMHDQTTVVRMADDDHISETVIFAVAEARNLSPSDLDTPLYEVIDGEALQRIISDNDSRPDFATTRVEFTWARCDVVVHGNGRVVVTRPTDR